MPADSLIALAVVTAAHAGFQLTVTVLVYPALAASDTDAWPEAHSRHSRSITPLVVASYGALVLAAAWAALTAPVGPALVVALVAVLATVATTGLVAAPLHGRLSRAGPLPVLLERLRRADLVRCAFAVVALAAALAALLRA